MKILQGDWITRLKELPDASVHCCVTSPPYWGLRDYGIEGQLGLEKTPEEYVAKVVEGFREVRRVLRDDGTLWMNLGDCYSAQAGQRKSEDARGPKQCTNRGSTDLGSRDVPGLKPKDLVGIPWRVAFALQADGWWLRQDIIWHKPNPMPESVTDRCTKSHEYIFLLTKSARYFFDAEAIKERASTDPHNSGYVNGEEYAVGPMNRNGHSQREDPDRVWAQDGTRNKRSVWTVPSQPYPESHFATFPEDLIKPCILAGTSARGCCPKCGAPWERVVERSRATFERAEDPTMETGRAGMNRRRPGLSDRYVLSISQPELAKRLKDSANGREAEMREIFGSKWDHWTRTDDSGSRIPTFEDAERLKGLIGAVIPFDGEPIGWKPSCDCRETGREISDLAGQPTADSAFNPIPCTVLDPFLGSGTTAQVALELGRRAIGIELNPAYILLAERRTHVTPGLQLA